MNLSQIFSILFWLNKAKMNKQVLIPIWIRIAVDGRVRRRAPRKNRFIPSYGMLKTGRVLDKFGEASVNITTQIDMKFTRQSTL